MRTFNLQISWIITFAASLSGSIALARAPSTAPSTEVNLRRTVVVDVAERTKDAVVYISTRKIISRQIGPFVENAEGGSLGSGFIVHPDGYVVTNNHVIDRAREIQVELLDGRKLTADLISADTEADIAILRIHSEKPLPFLALGDSEHLLIGEPVIAVGNPLGFSHTVSTGIVSAEHRDLKTPNGDVALGDLIQTDAAINPGNSGGPLLNAYGQVIGINTAVRGDAQNIGFAIGIDRLRNLVPELMNPAEANKVDLPLKLKEMRTFTEPATVTATVCLDDNSEPVTSIDGAKPVDIIDAYAILLRNKEGDHIRIATADGKTRTVDAVAVPTPDAIVQAKDRFGLVVEALTPLTAQKFGINDEDGMLITQVFNNSIAGKAGMQPGDVIRALGRYPVRSLNEFSALMHIMPQSGPVRFLVSRGGQLVAAVVQLKKASA